MKAQKQKVQVSLKKLYQVARWKSDWPEDKPAEVIKENPPYPWELEGWEFDIDLLDEFESIEHEINCARDGEISFAIYEKLKGIFETNKHLYDRIYLTLNYSDDDHEYAYIAPEIFGERYETDEEFEKRVLGEQEAIQKAKADKEKKKAEKLAKKQQKEMETLKALKEKYENESH